MEGKELSIEIEVLEERIAPTANGSLSYEGQPGNQGNGLRGYEGQPTQKATISRGLFLYFDFRAS
ncbi:MAG: hypothetical protein DMG17_28520 [Acidobacteria bacterium]|nr:MAG: hypothetical protein DMG17_28520 [Acidobacteriota bacterium]